MGAHGLSRLGQLDFHAVRCIGRNRIRRFVDPVIVDPMGRGQNQSGIGPFMIVPPSTAGSLAALLGRDEPADGGQDILDLRVRNGV
ncbi:MAG: hypothetical protein M5U35_14330 [Roseovarius sp.]|nr:hypothetical protein [Roseovarius sp.]